MNKVLPINKQPEVGLQHPSLFYLEGNVTYKLWSFSNLHSLKRCYCSSQIHTFVFFPRTHCSCRPLSVSFTELTVLLKGTSVVCCPPLTSGPPPPLTYLHSGCFHVPERRLFTPLTVSPRVSRNIWRCWRHMLVFCCRDSRSPSFSWMTGCMYATS